MKKLRPPKEPELLSQILLDINESLSTSLSLKLSRENCKGGVMQVVRKTLAFPSDECQQKALLARIS
jgi:hypothetical protein